jgi:hypothetical protein
MNLLREYIRELLTESIDSKIMSMIDRAEEAGFRGYVKDGYAAIYDPAIDVSDRSPGYVGFANRVAGVMWNHISTGEFGFPCSGARAVSISGSEDFGMGPLAYDLAIEASGGLMSDRAEVSKEAENVWRYYMKNRPDVIVTQLDNEKNKLTPEEEDNCPHPSRFSIKSPLTKMYSKAGTPVMDELRKRGMLEER